MNRRPKSDRQTRRLFAAITRVRQRYPDAEAAGVPAIKLWHIYATNGESGTQSVGTGESSFAAWIDADRRIGGDA